MYKSLYQDTDSIKCVNELSAEQRKEFMKIWLNSVYGTMCTDYKENNMRIKDFIVVHANGQPVMIKKEAITTVAKTSNGATQIAVTGGNMWTVVDTYEDVIKRLFDI